MRENYDTSGPGKYEGEGPLTAYLDGRTEWADDVAGGLDTLGVHAARFGKRILLTDSQGFVTLNKYEDEATAKLALEDYRHFEEDE